jgi:hypothetical protein
VSVQVEIMFDDLNEEKQKELLEAVGIDAPEEMNWDTFAVSVFEVEDDGEPFDYCDDCRHRGETTCSGAKEGCWEH